VLVAATAGFLGYNRLRARHALLDLPKKLGADIRQQADAFTYSQTVEGRTIFTIHAAKAIQHTSGVYTLHDVGIVLYGQASGQPQRVDRIYGNEFEYDKNNGVIHAPGEVRIDLQVPAPADAAAKMDYAEGKDLKAGPKDERLIHLKTSNLVFTQKTGIAATDQEIEFTYDSFTGHAQGAEYDTRSGILILRSAVMVSGVQGGRPIALTAAQATLDRQNRKTILTEPKYMTTNQTAQQTAEARHAVVYTRPDGSVERVEADGSVTMTDGKGARVVSSRAEVLLSAQSQPQSARMMDGVQYNEDTAERKVQGSSQEAHAAFDARGRLQHVVLNGGVSLHES